MHLLVGDIGGTKTELALFASAKTGARPVCSARYPSREFDSLEVVLKRFLEEFDRPEIGAAAFGVAGPVVNRQCRTTNLPWIIDEVNLSSSLHCPVHLFNDFAAVALGVGELEGDQLHVLQKGERDPNGLIAILGAGTGLGEALVVPQEQGLPRVFSSEGGHCDLAPRNELEMSLLRFLQRRHGRVSVERAVSGPGLSAIFDFVVESGHAIPQPATLAALNQRTGAAVISEGGLSGNDPACTKALQLFVSLYGAEAGNLALKTLPKGGLFIAGGIAPKVLPALADGRFLEAALDKGRMRPLLENLPIAIVLEPHVALQGAMRAAASLLPSANP